MAKLIVMVISKERSGDPHVDRHRWQAGDVVTVLADDVVLSKTVLDDPQFRVVDLPDISPKDVSKMLEPEIGYNDLEAQKNNRGIQRRAFRLDIAALDIELKKGAKVPLNKIRNAIKEKEKLIDPTVLGPPLKTVRTLG